VGDEAKGATTMKGRRARERLGYRLYHATYVARDGTTREAQAWTAEFRDALEQVRRLTLFTSKSASDEAARRLVRLVADKQASGKVSDPELVQWASRLPQRVRKRLAAWDLLEPERVAAGRLLEELLDEWQAALQAKSTTGKHARQQRKRARVLIDLCGFKRLTDVQRGRVESTLAKLRDGSIEGQRRVRQRTSNGYLQALGSFCRWAVAERMLGENPLAQAQRVTVTDASKRRALTIDEQRALIEAAQRGPERFGMSGTERAILYRVALATGFRASELAALRRRSFDITGDPPTASLAASETKNRKGAVQPLPRWLAELLGPFLELKTPDTPAFNMPNLYNLAGMLRADLFAAREAWLNDAPTLGEREEREQSDFMVPDTDEGRVDFHSLRHTFGTNLARAGVPVKTAMDLMRHSDVNLTMRLYSHTVLSERGAAVEALPDLTAPARERARATGTDHATAAADDAARLASCLAETGRFEWTRLDSDRRIGENDQRSQVPVNTAEMPKTTGENAICACSSAGQSSGLLIRRSQVRVLAGALREAPDRASLTGGTPFAFALAGEMRGLCPSGVCQQRGS